MGTLHRLPRRAPDRRSELGADELEVAFVTLGALFWIASVTRVLAAVARREVFGAEASLAFMCMFAVPWFSVRSWLGRRARHRDGARRMGCTSVWLPWGQPRAPAPASRASFDA